jgi:hypothetical protein
MIPHLLRQFDRCHALSQIVPQLLDGWPSGAFARACGYFKTIQVNGPSDRMWGRRAREPRPLACLLTGNCSTTAGCI